MFSIRVFPRVIFVALWLCAPALFAQSPMLPPKEKFHLFLLVGQSNMAGRGVVTPADQAPLPRILMLNKAGEWVPAIDPMHFDKPVAGVGLGRSFAAVIAAANPGVTIGLIPCAVGGSPIDTWKPGVLYKETNSYPWDDTMRRAKLALEAGTFKGILWHQGESDTNTPELARAYAPKLRDVVERLRAELKAPNVPFVLGQLGRFEGRPWNESQILVDQAHRDLPKLVGHAAFVSAEGLKDKGDKIHFDADSYRELGRRYAEAFLKLERAP